MCSNGALANIKKRVKLLKLDLESDSPGGLINMQVLIKWGWGLGLRICIKLSGPEPHFKKQDTRVLKTVILT